MVQSQLRLQRSLRLSFSFGVADVKRLPVLRHCADYNLIFFWLIWIILLPSHLVVTWSRYRFFFFFFFFFFFT